jgi:hypothetical protein
VEASWQKDFRAGLQAYLLKDQPRDPATWPMVQDAPIYDPKRHCPAQPIARRRLSTTSPRSRSALKHFHLERSEQACVPGWIYDHASGELRRTKAWDSPKRILQDALQGAPPLQDLATAILEFHLDDGSLQTSHAAFAHAYADRSGTVFPGITLYDAWASGAEMEMPDVECLGIVHDVLDNWRTWKAPVRKQKSLYETIGELFTPLRQHRGLRRALAEAYLSSDKSLLGDYASNQLQALWEDCASTPPTLFKRLPDSKSWKRFLDDWNERLTEDAELHQKARLRSNSLDRSATNTRAILLRILRENELLMD